MPRNRQSLIQARESMSNRTHLGPEHRWVPLSSAPWYSVPYLDFNTASSYFLFYHCGHEYDPFWGVCDFPDDLWILLLLYELDKVSLIIQDANINSTQKHMAHDLVGFIFKGRLKSVMAHQKKAIWLGKQEETQNKDRLLFWKEQKRGKHRKEMFWYGALNKAIQLMATN